MDTNNTENAITAIKDSLKSLGFQLIGEVRQIENGFELVINLENKKRIAKKTIKSLLESKNLIVSDIDVFIDICGHYAYALVNPGNRNEVSNG